MDDSEQAGLLEKLSTVQQSQVSLYYTDDPIRICFIPLSLFPIDLLKCLSNIRFNSS